MKQLLLRLSLCFVVIHINDGYSIPRLDLPHPTKLMYKDKDGDTLTISENYLDKPTLKEITYYHIVEKPYPGKEGGEKIETKDSEESKETVQPALDPRKEKRDDEFYYSEIPAPFHRKKREISKFQNNEPGGRIKREYYSYWQPFSPELSTLHLRNGPAYIRDFLSAQKPVLVNEDDEAYFELSSYDSEEPNDVKDSDIIEYLELDDSDNNNSPAQSAGLTGNKDSDFKSDYKSGVGAVINNSFKEQISPSNVSEYNLNNTAFEKDRNSHEVSDSRENESCEYDDDCAESNADENFNFDDILNEIHQIFVEENSTIKLMPGAIGTSENLNIVKLLHTISKVHNNSNTPRNSNTKSLDVLRGLFTNIIRNNIIVNDNVPVNNKPISIIAEKDTADDQQYSDNITEKTIFETSTKDQETTIESPKENINSNIEKNREKSVNSSGTISEDIGKRKDNISTPLPLESTTGIVFVNSSEEIHSHNLSNTDRPMQVSPVTSATESKSSSKGEEGDEPATSIPMIDDKKITNKSSAAEVEKTVDFISDLVNNENFWKFLGDLGVKYLESLMAHADSLIEEKVSAQVKERLDALKLNDKVSLEKKKEETKDDKAVKDDKPITESYSTISRKKTAEHNNNKDALSISAYNMFGNTVGNDKVTNVYVFHANENIDEVIKNVYKLVNKVKPANSTNIYTFVTNQYGLNNEQSKPTSEVNEETNDLPNPTIRKNFTDDFHNEHKPTEPAINISKNRNDAENERDSNRLNTESNVKSDQPTIDDVLLNTTFAENIKNSTETVRKNFTDDFHNEHKPTEPAINKSKNRNDAENKRDSNRLNTESNVKSDQPTIDDVLLNTTFAENIKNSTESLISIENTTEKATSSGIQSESIMHSTESSKPITDGINPVTISRNLDSGDDGKMNATVANTTPATDNKEFSTEAVFTSETATLHITTVSTTETGKGSSLNTDSNDLDNVITESAKPVTEIVTETALTTESTVDSTQNHIENISTTEISEPKIDNINVSIDNTTSKTAVNTSNNEEIKVTTEMSQSANKIKGLKDIAGSTTESSNNTAINNENNDSAKNGDNIGTTESSVIKTDNNNDSTKPTTSETTANTSNDNEIKVTSVSPITTKTSENVKDITESTTESTNKIELNIDTTASTQSYNENLTTTESSKGNTDITNVPSTSESTANTIIDTEIKVTTETSASDGTTKDLKDTTESTTESANNTELTTASTPSNTENISTTASSEGKSDNNNDTEPTTSETAVNTSNDSNIKGTTESSESTNITKDVTELTESTTEKHKEAAT